MTTPEDLPPAGQVDVWRTGADGLRYIGRFAATSEHAAGYVLTRHPDGSIHYPKGFPAQLPPAIEQAGTVTTPEEVLPSDVRYKRDWGVLTRLVCAAGEGQVSEARAGLIATYLLGRGVKVPGS